MRSMLKTIALLGIGLLCAPAFGANPARPGTVNYVEGSAFLDGQLLTHQSVGSAYLNPGEVLSTTAGKAEILLTPGIFMRLGDNSAVKMISPDLTLTQVELEHGRTGVEVDEIYPQNNVEVIDGGVTTQLIKNGYYEFDASPAMAKVFDGRAEVEERQGRFTTVKNHHEIALAPGVKARTISFDAKAAEGDLYNWSSLRSEYLAEDNAQIAPEYAGAAGFYPGWYWDPWAWDYTFIGGGPFWSPFGWGFYPPWWGGIYGYYGGGYYGGHHGYRFHGHGGVGNPRGGPIRGGGFHGGGGLRAGGGGFHGGGFGGGGGFRGGGGHR